MDIAVAATTVKTISKSQTLTFSIARDVNELQAPEICMIGLRADSDRVQCASEISWWSSRQSRWNCIHKVRPPTIEITGGKWFYMHFVIWTCSEEISRRSAFESVSVYASAHIHSHAYEDCASSSRLRKGAKRLEISMECHLVIDKRVLCDGPVLIWVVVLNASSVSFSLCNYGL